MPAACDILLSWKNWILHLTAVLFCHTLWVIQDIVPYRFSEQHSYQVWPVLAHMFHKHNHVTLVDSTLAL